MINPRTLAWLIALIGTNVVSFFTGIFTERARTERKIKKIREQILILSNRSALIEDRYNKLLYSCALYSLCLEKANNADKEKIRELVQEFEPIFNLIKEAKVPIWERIKIRLSIKRAKKDILKEIA